MAALSAVMAIMLFLRKWTFFGKGFCAVLAWGSLWAYVFKAIRTSAMGDDEVHTPDFSDFFNDLVVPAIRGTAGTALIWLPSIVYLLWMKNLGWYELLEFNFLNDPVLWLVIAVSLVYVPMALAVGATGGGVFRMLNPALVMIYIGRIGVDYWIALMVIGAFGAVYVVLQLLSSMVSQLPIPFLGPWLAQLLLTYPPFAMANVMGLLLYVRGDRVDYGLPEEYRMDVLQGVEPQGAPVVVAEAIQPAPEPRNYAPIELEPETEAVAEIRPIAAAHRPAQSPRSPASKAPSPTEQIASAAANGDWAKALEFFAKMPNPASPSLSPDCYFGLAQAAVKKADYRQAVRALKALMTSSPDDPVAPRACVLLARIYSERLSDPLTGEKLFRHVVQRYPSSKAAQFAQGRLARKTEPYTA
jgi:hypothetical protein